MSQEEQQQPQRQKRVYKEKPKRSPSKEREKAEQERLDAEFNAKADKRAKNVRAHAEEVLADSGDFLRKLDNILKP